MAKFGRASRENLRTCDERLVRVFKEVVKEFDCKVIDGYRGEQAQEDAYKRGRSRVQFPNSRHNRNPSQAVDVVPYPVDWSDIHRFYYFGGYVVRTAETMGILLRWGGDWDGDYKTKDNTFNDLAHFEIEQED